MKDIEFRAWNGHKMCRVEMIDFDSNYLEQYVVLQYTGLKDKNGKKIFEGDVIKTHFGDQELVCYGEYDNGFDYSDNERGYGWYLKVLKGSSIVTISSIIYVPQESREVIGNIYENPELLEAKP